MYLSYKAKRCTNVEFSISCFLRDAICCQCSLHQEPSSSGSAQIDDEMGLFQTVAGFVEDLLDAFMSSATTFCKLKVFAMMKSVCAASIECAVCCPLTGSETSGSKFRATSSYSNNSESGPLFIFSIIMIGGDGSIPALEARSFYKNRRQQSS